MTRSPGAGKPAEASMLVNVPALITAYYTEVPDPAVPEQRVAFGTSDIVAPHSTRRSRKPRRLSTMLWRRHCCRSVLHQQTVSAAKEE
jgi:hypothetical protein